MLKRSLLDYAYDYLVNSAAKEPKTFKEIYEYVCESAGLTEEEARKNISKFYTNLTLDGRFLTLGENIWDLRENQTYENVNIDMNAVYADDDEVEITEEVDEEDFDIEEILDNN